MPNIENSMTEDVTKKRPPFILNIVDIDEVPGKYADGNEVFSYGRAIGLAAGLLRTRFHLERLPPGHRTDLPHALENEEEFYFVQEGRVEAWIDGVIHTMATGDIAAFPSGTGIAHTFINNGEKDALLLVGGERRKPDGQIVYPLESNQSRGPSSTWSEVWEDAPRPSLGSADSSMPRGVPALSSATVGLKSGINACKNNTQRTRGF